MSVSELEIQKENILTDTLPHYRKNYYNDIMAKLVGQYSFTFYGSLLAYGP